MILHRWWGFALRSDRTGRWASISLPIWAAVSLGTVASTAFAGSESDATRALKTMSVEELLRLEVTSVSRRPERLSETASAIQVITGDDIRRSGATSIPEALRLASNLEVARINSREWAITARGFNNALANKMLVLIDGRLVYTPLYAGVFWDAQDTFLEDIERIEVISGPGATQWGSNAVNGVISVTTKSSRDTQGALLSAGGGSELRNFGGLRLGGSPRPDLTYRVYAKYADRDHSVLSNGEEFLDSWRMGQGGFRMDWDRGSADLLTVQGDLYQGTLGQPGSPDTEIDGLNLLTRWSHSLSEAADMRLQVYYDRTHRDIPNALVEDLETVEADFQYHFRLASAHDLVWGLNYRRVDDDIRNTPGIGFLPPKISLEWFSGFIQDDISLIADRLNLTVGTKIERNDYTELEWQPSVRIGWKPLSNHTLWAALSRAVRTPSRIDTDFFVPSTPPFLLRGDPDFTAEALVAYEAGYRTQVHSELVLSLATFYHDYDDLRSIEPLNPPALVPAVLANGLRGKSYGAELTADYQVTESWRLRMGYTELRADSEPKPHSLDRSSSRSFALDPHRQFLLRSSMDLWARVELDATIRYVGSIDYQDVPDYTELDLRLGWRPSRTWEFSLVGQNLLHDHHPEFGALPSRREIERAVYGKLTWRF